MTEKESLILHNKRAQSRTVPVSANAVALWPHQESCFFPPFYLSPWCIDCHLSPATLTVPKWRHNSKQHVETALRNYKVMVFSFIFPKGKENFSRILQQSLLTTQQPDVSIIPKLINGSGNGNYIYWFKLVKMHFYLRWLILKPEFSGGSFSHLSQTLSCLQFRRMEFC